MSWGHMGERLAGKTDRTGLEIQFRHTSCGTLADGLTLTKS